ncbi:MAG: triphosphoribosyl-dephospho-CoA synthase [Methylobacter sp.]|uniref:triphosphoribosyl-dephospho-CoA synthase n=1 Tax=Methylobacter sp. TaxID=2051955 RepID=UPI002731DB26|nr:triphosphoribosyl-dephospho-CoA synthase [Methylobacter sp.]MDP1666885.1 triphosphoribosyl-dephospho-CoA synthase [Methylobacter sp.]MDP1969599.1 triphosphoribosyl-dephospho-CoA synthase [Methylobacter sp.]
MISPEQLSELYRQACEVDVQAFKPGNVSVYAEGHDMTVADFRTSAKVSAEPLCNPDYSLGEKIYYAVKATREAVGCNTNLGIVLLCAPLIQAISHKDSELTLRQAVSKVIAETTIEDADWVFKAITLASPGGLGSSDQQDVNEKASVTLTEAMKIAGAKDRIALQYTTDYQDIFNFLLLRYNISLDRWGDRNWAAVAVYADMLSQFPDSHIERKYGDQYSEMIATKMAQLSEELSKTDNPEQIKPLLFCLDQELKLYDINPGTTADMIVATVLTAFLEDLNQ